MAATATPRSNLHWRSTHGDEVRGSKTHVFRPPPTPTPGASTPNASYSSSRQQVNSRKRSRASSPAVASASTPNVRLRNGFFDTPPSAVQVSGWSRISNNAFDSAQSSVVRSPASPPPFVDTRYNLAGGLDTPAAVTEARYDGESDYMRAGEGFRRGWGDNPPAETGDRRPLPSSANGGGWSHVVFNIINGVAGRVLDFCKSGASFTGFYAGGGKGYALESSSSLQSVWEDVDHMAQSTTTTFEFIATPLPGQYPEDSPPPERAAKRTRSSGGGWIVVPQPTDNPQGHSKPRSRPSNPGTSARRSVTPSRLPRPSASKARSRPSLAPTMIDRRQSSTATHAGSPMAAGGSRQASTASPRSPGLYAPSSTLSPGSKRYSGGSTGRPSSSGRLSGEKGVAEMSPDAQKFQARIKREERERDQSMRKMNAKLQDMIREGKAALGTKVEVETDDEMELSLQQRYGW